ncbi:MAG TPA: hypothetical protein VKS81_10320 [Bacteroidota bacterium]|nr:hypothetical protein [Bacteroidota bacterium]
MKSLLKRTNLSCALAIWLLPVVCGLACAQAWAQDKPLIELRDFTDVEVKSAGFTLPSDMHIHVKALGGGNDRSLKSGEDMYAYGWIIDADTRKNVWVMSQDNTHKSHGDREFDGDVILPKGSYEVYFAAYGFAESTPFNSFNINVDRRKDFSTHSFNNWGLFPWIADLLGEDLAKDWKNHVKAWYIDIYTSDPGVKTFAPPKEFEHIMYQAVKVGENENIKQAFTVSKPTSIRIYAIGEMSGESDPVDYGWIVNADTRKRVWDMNPDNLEHAGGAEKNVRCNDTVDFEPGEYVLYYVTDDSHSYVDWNAAPPDDPPHYGVTLMTVDGEGGAKLDDNFKLTTIKEDKNVIAEMIKVGDNETRSSSFSLKQDARVRIYALGERSNSRHEMADYGWIINSRTREKVWTMDYDKSEPAGGASKNRLVDEVITLPKGTYTVYYQSDDSHSYHHWNAAPPFDPEHWGITLSLEKGEEMSIVEKNVTPKESGVIAQIVKVGDHEDRTQRFELKEPTHVRIYALGEGQNDEMFDYGWIENTTTGEVVWQMTYSMTFHAGGGRKNRMVNTKLLLDKGSYRLRYTSDDSHSFLGGWNTDPPDDPTMWGITVYEEKQP